MCVCVCVLQDITQLYGQLVIEYFFCVYRKSTFDMFNFLASQHRQLPDIELYDDEEDDVLLKSTRSGPRFPWFPRFPQSLRH